MEAELRVSGFVLAGGRSERMGMDKALLQFNGRLMLAIALETLRSVCDDVFIAGNREDLAEYAPVVGETRIGEGPAAGIESALRAAQQEWIMALPIDLPLMSAELLRRWMAAVSAAPQVRASYLECAGDWHPALCLVHRECLPTFREALDASDRKLTRIFSRLGERLLVVDASVLMPDAARFFVNVNTPEELVAAQRQVAAGAAG